MPSKQLPNTISKRNNPTKPPKQKQTRVKTLSKQTKSKTKPNQQSNIPTTINQTHQTCQTKQHYIPKQILNQVHNTKHTTPKKTKCNPNKQHNTQQVPNIIQGKQHKSSTKQTTKSVKP